MGTTAFKFGILLGALSITGLIGCAGQEDGGFYDSCADGTCDDWDPLRGMQNLLRTDKASVRISQFMEVGRAPFEKVACNDIGARLLVDDVSVWNETNMQSVLGSMTERLGEKELATEVQAARLETLRSPGAAPEFVEADAYFDDVEISPDFGVDTGGFGDTDREGRAYIGFNAGAALGYRFVYNMEDGRSGFVDDKIAPDTLENMCDDESRGFIVPRGLDDLRKMKVGELAALHGDGRLGTNAGFSVPIMLTTTGPFTVHAVLRAGRSTQLEGRVDTQVVRLADNQVVLDVGIQDARVKRKHLQLNDDWGVQGFCGDVLGVDCDTEILGKSLDDLVDDAVEKAFDKKLNLFNVEWRNENGPYRMSVARIRLDLDEIDDHSFISEEGISSREAADVAINQAMVGDLRALEALIYREDPGIDIEWDFLQSGHQATSSFGVEVLGIDVWGRAFEEGNQSTVLQTPDAIDTLFSEKLHESSGWNGRRGFTRIGVGSLHYDKQLEILEGRTNLIVQTVESGYLDSDELLDHLEGSLVAAIGMEAFGSMETFGNELMQDIDAFCDDYVDSQCHGTAGLSCPTAARKNCIALVYEEFEDRHMDGFRSTMTAADGVSRTLDAELASLVNSAMQSRYTAQMCRQQHSNGVKGSVVTDIRIDQDALAELTAPGAAEVFEFRVRNYLELADISRFRNTDAERAKVADKDYDKLDDMVTAYRRYAQEYRIAAAAEELAAATFGAHATQITLSGADHDAEITDRNPLQEATASSMAAARARAATKLFDAVHGEGERSHLFNSDIGPRSEFTVAYALAAMVPPAHQDMRVHVELDPTDSEQLCEDWIASRLSSDEPYGGRAFDLSIQGDAAQRITFGAFDVDAVIGLVDVDDD